MISLQCDLHTHTLYSRHAYSTVMENLAAAKASGIDVLGITDHFSSMVYNTNNLRDFQYFMNMHIWPRIYQDVLLLRGAEVDIVSLDGSLFGQNVQIERSVVDTTLVEPKSLYQLAVRDCDYVIASVHNNTFANAGSVTQATNMYIKALEHSKVFILGHIGRSGVKFDIDEVLQAAKAHHKLIEINNHSLGYEYCFETCKHIAQRCAELDVNIAVNTDAHIATEIAQFPRVTSLLEEIHFPEHLIVNASKDRLLQQMQKAQLNINI